MFPFSPHISSLSRNEGKLNPVHFILCPEMINTRKVTSFPWFSVCVSLFKDTFVLDVLGGQL